MPSIIKFVTAAVFTAFLLISPAQAKEPQSCVTPTQVYQDMKDKGIKIEKIVTDRRMIDYLGAVMPSGGDFSLVGGVFVYSLPGVPEMLMAFYDRGNCLVGAAVVYEHHLQSIFGSDWREGTF